MITDRPSTSATLPGVEVAVDERLREAQRGDAVDRRSTPHEPPPARRSVERHHPERAGASRRGRSSNGRRRARRAAARGARRRELVECVPTIARWIATSVRDAPPPGRSVRRQSRDDGRADVLDEQPALVGLDGDHGRDRPGTARRAAGVTAGSAWNGGKTALRHTSPPAVGARSRAEIPQEERLGRPEERAAGLGQAIGHPGRRPRVPAGTRPARPERRRLGAGTRSSVEELGERAAEAGRRSPESGVVETAPGRSPSGGASQPGPARSSTSVGIGSDPSASARRVVEVDLEDRASRPNARGAADGAGDGRLSRFDPASAAGPPAREPAATSRRRPSASRRTRWMRAAAARSIPEVGTRSLHSRHATASPARPSASPSPSSAR